tara:strand:- start:270 stop:1637 length:1368 start_codon:yes stop_codon:yes gene_type:complete
MRIVVLDDDPTGSQTVHSCHLLLSWDISTLREGIRNQTDLLFILANTRVLTENKLIERIKIIANNLKEALRLEGIKYDDLLFISRGDSTLRGHGFLEPKLISNELGPFKAVFHIPAFFEGGRKTINGIHFLNDIPVHKTIFSQDPRFGFSTSDLTEWLLYKSSGEILPKNILRITIDMLNSSKINLFDNKKNQLQDFLCNLKQQHHVIVDANKKEDLEILVNNIRSLKSKKNFLFRSAASFINAISGVDSKIISSKEIYYLKAKDSLGNCKPGIVIVGSYIKLSENQLELLLKQKSWKGLELSVSKFESIFFGTSSKMLLNEMKSELISQGREILLKNYNLVLYTSREIISLTTELKQVDFEIALAKFMAVISSELSCFAGFFISKGGTTTNTFLVDGLKAKSVYLHGQIMPGLSLVYAKTEKNSFPVVTFPGNLGNDEMLLQACQIMSGIKTTN